MVALPRSSRSPLEQSTALCWRPDGKRVAVGYSGVPSPTFPPLSHIPPAADGSVSIHDVENGEVLYFFSAISVFS